MSEAGYVFALISIFLLVGLTTFNLLWSEKILSRVQNYTTDYQPLEVVDYDPKTDILAIFVGTEDNIPPQEVVEEIYKELKDIEECKLLVAPGVFRIVVLKG